MKDPRCAGAFTAIVTPFTEDGSAIDHVRLGEQIAFQAQGGIRGVVICGTTGESPTLTASEYRELVGAGVKLAHEHDLLAIVGTGSNSTAHAVDLQKVACDLGADLTLSVNPYYNKPTQDGLRRHFLEVAEAADIGVMLYNIPGRTGVALEPSTVASLNEHGRIVANKEATSSTTSASEIIASCPGLSVLSGDDPMTLPLCSVGAVGVVSVVANIVPDRVAALCAACLEDRWDDARGLHQRLLTLMTAMFLETNPIPIKAAMRMLGRDTGSMRLPMTPATSATERGLERALAANDLM